ncbi:Alpha/Beta hydrolase protein [Neurospora hispaniola]|uniref:Alpha/Beta hydrolase protein n=1 Tax=Neurospora hispaniola TaxID=588809 RepID=A0AAJ0I5N4_9PEZI|nr:Alpha/Beta hydrolase protein [Neurospora hispaniola]
MTQKGLQVNKPGLTLCDPPDPSVPLRNFPPLCFFVRVSFNHASRLHYVGEPSAIRLWLLTSIILRAPTTSPPCTRASERRRTLCPWRSNLLPWLPFRSRWYQAAQPDIGHRGFKPPETPSIMIDHLLGRPSAKSRRLQVLAVLGFWSAYLIKGHKHGPPGFRIFSRLLSRRLTTWQTVILTMIYLYAARNFSTLVGLASPEPMANMYDAAYFRATWVLTALDAGFWTAMKIKQKWLRDISSIAFSLFYLVAAEKADEKVRKVRGNLTVEHLRVSWNKGVTSPYLRFVQNLMRPRFTRWPPRQIRIPRPATSDYKDPVAAWLYYDGPLADLEYHNKIILDIPGGGFVAMDPRCNDDKLFSWAAKTGLPILSLDYKKAPEFPYPYALNECYDVYSTIIKTKGRCIGLSGREVPKIVVTGDSAGGTLATSMTLMIVESGSSPVRRFQGEVNLKVPDGLILFYPALDMNIGSWMSDEQMALIKDRRMRGTNKRIVQRKTSQYNDLVGTPAPSDDEDDGPSSGPSLVKEKEPSSAARSAPEYAHSGPSTWSHADIPSLSSSRSEKSKTTEKQARAKSSAVATTTTPSPTAAPHSHHPQPMRTRLAMSSMISYFADRVLTPEMMRAMIILYVGPHNRPDFSSDYLLCPILAPDILLSKFPKTYFLTGERDPLVDDTVIFAGRLKRVKAAMVASDGTRTQYREEDVDEAIRKTNGKWDGKQAAEVALVPGISHGFLQFAGVYPPAWGLFGKIAGWMGEVFAEAERKEREEERARRKMGVAGGAKLEEKAETGAAGRGTNEKGVGFGAVEEHSAEERTGRHHRRRGTGGTESSADEDKPLEMGGKARTRGRVALKNAGSLSEGNASTSADAREGMVNEDRIHVVEGAEGDEEGGSDTATEAATAANTKVKAKKAPRRMKLRRVKVGDEDGALLVRLDSSDDILGRRMQGLAGGLTGLQEAE